MASKNTHENKRTDLRLRLGGRVKVKLVEGEPFERHTVRLGLQRSLRLSHKNGCEEEGE